MLGEFIFSGLMEGGGGGRTVSFPLTFYKASSSSSSSSSCFALEKEGREPQLRFSSFTLLVVRGRRALLETRANFQSVNSQMHKERDPNLGHILPGENLITYVNMSHIRIFMTSQFPEN